MASITIRVPKVFWSLGDTEQTTQSGLTTLSRALYYSRTGEIDAFVRIGSIHPDYAQPLMAVLSKSK